jgi:hypothetical protein
MKTRAVVAASKLRRNLPEKLQKPHMVAGVQAEVLTEHHSNTSPSHYHYSNLLSPRWEADSSSA